MERALTPTSFSNKARHKIKTMEFNDEENDSKSDYEKKSEYGLLFLHKMNKLEKQAGKYERTEKAQKERKGMDRMYCHAIRSFGISRLHKGG